MIKQETSSIYLKTIHSREPVASLAAVGENDLLISYLTYYEHTLYKINTQIVVFTWRKYYLTDMSTGFIQLIFYKYSFPIIFTARQVFE